MKLNTLRPSALLAAACAPSASALSVTPVQAARRVPVSHAHQVQIQAELVLVGSAYEFNGTTGFVASDGTVKPMTDNAGGVPPRGRPV